MADLILHHYDFSSFAEKPRMIMGHKGLAWHSVEQPMVMPKPLLLPLTGGYRRIPVLQVGADVYCDTRCIAEELERRHPQPTLFPEHSRGQCEAISMWGDNALSWACGRYATGLRTDSLPQEFFDDRSAMWGLPPSVNRAAGVVTRYHVQLVAQLDWLEPWCAGGPPFLLGAAPSLADYAVYQALYFLTVNGAEVQAVLDPFPAVRDWMGRVAAIGHGRPTPLAGEAPPAGDGSPDPSGLRPGDGVAVMPTDYARDPVEGTLVALTRTRVTLRREDPAVGVVHVHFPRLNYRVRGA
jgi:glutathione S-transferase